VSEWVSECESEDLCGGGGHYNIITPLLQFTHSLTHSLTHCTRHCYTYWLHPLLICGLRSVDRALTPSLPHSLTPSLMSMYTNRVCMRVARARTSLSNHCFTHSFCTLPHSLTPVEKKSKRAAKKAAFGSQKGVDITSRSDSYSAWWVSEWVCVYVCVHVFIKYVYVCERVQPLVCVCMYVCMYVCLYVSEWVTEWLSDWVTEWLSDWVSEWNLCVTGYRVLLFYFRYTDVINAADMIDQSPVRGCMVLHKYYYMSHTILYYKYMSSLSVTTLYIISLCTYVYTTVVVMTL
jgi:hypothetical protein